MKFNALRFHSRGNHGMVTAAEITAKQIDAKGSHASTTPHFGTAKAGEPIKVDVRVSRSPIRDVYPIATPDIVVVSDDTLLAIPAVFAGITAETVFLVNSHKRPVEIATRFGLAHVVTVDATVIAQEEVGRSYPNIVLLGALVRMMQDAMAQSVQFPVDVARAVFEYFGGSDGKHALSNLKAFERGHDEIHRYDGVFDENPERRPRSMPLPTWRAIGLGAILPSLPEHHAPTTGAWSVKQPVVDQERCKDCLVCWPLCPDKAIKVNAAGELETIDLRACKGCGICMEVCPDKFNAITMQEKK